MAIELKQSLTLAQQLIMTPQLQQAIKLLQLSRMELVETITQEMEANPVLEEFGQEEYEEDTKAAPDKDETDTESSGLSEVTVEERVGDDIDWESYIEEYNTRPIETPYEKRDALPLENITAVKTNLYSHLMWQLNVSDLKDDQKFIGTHIIGNLDKNGYLDTSIEEISQTTGARPEEVVEILRFIQNFDPVGVAARDAREPCLYRQKHRIWTELS
jgi:RNA polymerase sigma-54 factor